MKYSIFSLLGILALSLTACQPSSRPIRYGEDICAFCKMTVVSKQHAAEVVTAKGRVYTFDALECMINYTQQNDETDFSYLLVNDYLAPGVLIDATSCQFLISENLPSPMGAFLSAFENEQQAKAMQAEKGGTLFNWEEINRHFKTSGLNYYE